MLKKLMATAAITGLMVGAAAAQSEPSASPTAAPTSGSAQFVNSQSADQWLSSNFIGTDVMGPDDSKIGDVNDVLFDKDGKIVAYVVGVGGFLGIGAKNVALAPSSFQVMPAASGTTGTGGTARADEVKLKLNMTKDQLQQAASFESKRDQESKTRATSPSPTGTGGGMGGGTGTSR